MYVVESGNAYRNSVTGDLLRTFSGSAGIEHLHKEMGGNHAAGSFKQPIAHRDVKSKNILIGDDGRAIIADLGLAIKLDDVEPRLKPRVEQPVGTTRYLPPEILDKRFNMTSFQSYKEWDIYSMTLVFWEVLWRTSDDPEEYTPKEAEELYAEFFEKPDKRNPTMAEMRDIVVRRKERPTIPAYLEEHKTLSQVTRRVRECWTDVPQNRLAAIRIRKYLGEIISNYKSLEAIQS
jgi:serine/threonine protein kinase